MEKKKREARGEMHMEEGIQVQTYSGSCGWVRRERRDRLTDRSQGEEEIQCMLSLCCQDPADSEYKAHKKAVAGLRGKHRNPKQRLGPGLFGKRLLDK